MKIAGWEVLPKNNELQRKGESIRLSPLAMDVLLHLANQAQSVVDTESLLARNWPADKGSDNALYKIISELRHALRDETFEGPIIKTVPKRGYCLMAPVTIDSPRSNSRVARNDQADEVLSQTLEAAHAWFRRKEYSHARQYFNIALDLCQRQSDPQLEAQINIHMAECLLFEQGKDAAAAYFEEARKIAIASGNHVQHARALLGLSGGLEPIIDASADDFKHQLQLIYRLLPPSETSLALRIRSRIINYTSPVDDPLIDEAKRVVAEARVVADRDALVAALLCLHTCYRNVGQMERNVEISRELFELVKDSDEPSLLVIAYLRRFSDLLMRGERAAAGELRDGLAALEPRFLYQDEINRMDAMFATMAGDYERAETLAMSISFRETGYLLMQFLQIVMIARRRGRAADVIPLVESVATIHTDIPAVSVYLALLYAECGNEEALDDELARIGDVSALTPDITWATTLTALIETTHYTRDKAMARTLLARVEPYRGYNVLQHSVCYFGAGEYFAGLLLDVLDEKAAARQSLSAALEMHRQMGCVALVEKTEALLKALE